ncbi:MAG: hypothetical protein ACSLFI_07735 [Solirubrobacterales bacterium]
MKAQASDFDGVRLEVATWHVPDMARIHPEGKYPAVTVCTNGVEGLSAVEFAQRLVDAYNATLEIREE